VALAGLAMMPGRASSHREAPLIASDQLADNTDVYAFVDPNEANLVTFVTNFIPLEFPSSGPNFHRFDDNVLYEVMIDNNGDAVEDLTNVHTIAFQVPIERLTRSGRRPTNPNDPEAVIGVWSPASRPAVTTRTPGGQTHSGNLIQVSRLGQPLVNELVIDLARKDAFNGLEPTGDAAALDRVTDPEVARLLTALFGVRVPPPPRNDIVTIFLTGIPGLNQPLNVRASEMLRLNMAIPPSTGAAYSRLGVLGGDLAGFPNGRRIGDDVVDIALRAMAGGTPLTPAFNVAPNNVLGDGVDQNDVAYLSVFPYLAPPHAGLDTNGPKVRSSGTTPTIR
jgi:hypothetical protein